MIKHLPTNTLNRVENLKSLRLIEDLIVLKPVSSLLSGNIPANRLFYSRENVAIKAERLQQRRQRCCVGYDFGA